MKTPNEIFSDLDTVNWSSLDHAFGDASNIPTLLIQLTDSSDEIASSAFESLATVINHQGTIGTATLAVIPYLIRLFASPSVCDQLRVGEMMLSLLRLACTSVPFNDPNVTEEARQANLIAAVHKELKSSAVVFAQVLRGSVRLDVRLVALELLSYCDICGPTVIAEIEATYFNTQNETPLRLSALLALCYLGVTNHDTRTVFEVASLADNKTEKCIALIGLTIIDRDQTRTEVLDTLVSIGRSLTNNEHDESTGLFFGRHGYPYLFGNAMMSDLLWGLRAARRDLGIASHTQLLRTAQDEAIAKQTVFSLLDLAFYGDYLRPTGRSFSSSGDLFDVPNDLNMDDKKPLDLLQMDAIRAIVDCDPYWQVPTNLLALFRLPASREGLKALTSAVR